LWLLRKQIRTIPVTRATEVTARRQRDRAVDAAGLKKTALRSTPLLRKRRR
jgi:hypothetical protein